MCLVVCRHLFSSTLIKMKGNHYLRELNEGDFDVGMCGKVCSFCFVAISLWFPKSYEKSL